MNSLLLTPSSNSPRFCSVRYYRLCSCVSSSYSAFVEFVLLMRVGLGLGLDILDLCFFTGFSMFSTGSAV
jgi:hypothetical protein